MSSPKNPATPRRKGFFETIEDAWEDVNTIHIPSETDFRFLDGETPEQSKIIADFVHDKLCAALEAEGCDWRPER